MRRHSTYGTVILTLASAIISTGCIGPQGKTPAEKRANAEIMRAEALEIFFSKQPDLRSKIDSAPGYGVFSGIGTHTIILSTGQGYGIIHDNATGEDFYMRALKLGAGLGAGVSGIYAVVVFHDAKTMNDIITDGWVVTGKGDAAAKVGDAGDAGSGVITLPGMSIYRFTKNGVMLSGAIEGAKLWPDKELN